jgi:hypothetical protein
MQIAKALSNQLLRWFAADILARCAADEIHCKGKNSRADKTAGELTRGGCGLEDCIGCFYRNQLLASRHF